MIAMQVKPVIHPFMGVFLKRMGFVRVAPEKGYGGNRLRNDIRVEYGQSSFVTDYRCIESAVNVSIEMTSFPAEEGVWLGHEARWPPGAQAPCRGDPGGAPGAQTRPENTPHPALPTLPTMVPRTGAREHRADEPRGQGLVTCSRRRGLGGWCVHSGCGAVWWVAGAAKGL
ncbi:hypothetical protein NDU88_003165 [Pleurodeles waltl]|uniref:Uncharacterized protein n=1 Tax=Pleurodeles waltl TaxID=8319 RepID=A0AAV7LHU4_PLEWA|nr:hypothetical protein NDU88_003165 [Pleurodeles waltl]